MYTYIYIYIYMCVCVCVCVCVFVCVCVCTGRFEKVTFIQYGVTFQSPSLYKQSAIDKLFPS